MTDNGEEPVRSGDPATRRYVEPAGPAPAGPAPGVDVAALPAGNLTGGVIRIGDTVRRPAQPQSLAVAHYLDHLERVGFAASPRFLGRDDAGRDVLSYLDGDVPGEPLPAWAAADDLLVSVAVLLRRLHEASSGFCAERGFAAPAGTVWRRDLVKVELPDPEPAPELVSHLDVVPGNVVVRDGLAAALIDFDLAGPTTRLLNLYTTAVHWVPLCPPERVPGSWAGIDQPRRLRLFVDGYGLSPERRLDLPAFGIARADITWRRMKASAEQLGGGWARMWERGAGDAILARKLWLADTQETLLAALR